MLKKIAGLLVLLLAIGGVWGAVDQEFEEDYSTIGTTYGKAVFGHLDSDSNGIDDALIVIGDYGTTLKYINTLGTPTVSWTKSLEKANEYALVPIDLNGDGYKNYFVGGTKIITAYDSSGNEVWSYDADSSVYSIVALDLNGDGTENEVVVGLWEKVVALSSSGKKMWSHNISGSTRKLATVDRDGDGKSEAVAMAFNNRVAVLGPHGNTITTISTANFEDNIAGLGSFYGKGGNSRLATIEVSGTSGEVKVFDLDGNKLWAKDVYAESSQAVDIIPLDYSGSGRKDHLAVFSGFIYIFDNQGNQEWSYTRTIFNDVALADIDGDGVEDEFFGSTDSRIYAIEDGNQVGYYYNTDEEEDVDPYDKTGAERLVSIDIDGDNRKDDVLGFTSTDIFTLSHITEAEKKSMVIVANTIDYRLASDLFTYLRDANYDAIHIFPEDFSSYRKEQNIVILGGHKAPEGTGEIVSELLTSQQEEALEEEGAVKHYLVTERYAVGQRIHILAGHTREETQQAHRQYRGSLL